MKFANLSATLIAAATCLTPYLPAHAGTQDLQPAGTPTAVYTNPAVNPTSTRTIPAMSAIAIAFPADLTLTADTEQTTTLFLAQPIFDEAGNEIAPKGALLSARLKPGKGGVSVMADFLVIRGRTVPIQASSVLIPGQTVTVQSGLDRAREASQVGGRLVGTAFGAGNINDVDGIKKGALAGTGIGLVYGLLSPKKATVVKIPQGSMYILTLQSAVTLP
ncbi:MULTISPECIES: hypothetical protein [Leptolyngbya]|uniref:hypothetical protein n=1 Tax=Leptolyngbya TaxID=47251 RepID=UPI001686C5E0|nr:hypothetical protein [Leptolyngbya sp. FACHB-1624]MBD1858771.1 hypothetical protein [Leptolyngbya sp. FACHB-1624]